MTVKNLTTHQHVSALPCETLIFMCSPPDCVSEDVVFSGCSIRCVCSLLRTDIVTMESHARLEQFDNADREYSLAPT